MAKTRAQKAETLEQLKAAFAKAKSLVFSDYQGMTVPRLTDLRKRLHGVQVDYIVAKKTVLNLAAKQSGLDVDFKILPGMIGVAAAFEDEAAGAKVIGEVGAKEAPIKLLGGVFEGKTVDRDYVVTLSRLPNKPQLLGQLLSVMNGPMSAFARLLNAYREQREASPSSL